MRRSNTEPTGEKPNLLRSWSLSLIVVGFFISILSVIVKYNRIDGNSRGLDTQGQVLIGYGSLIGLALLLIKYFERRQANIGLHQANNGVNQGTIIAANQSDASLQATQGDRNVNIATQLTSRAASIQKTPTTIELVSDEIQPLQTPVGVYFLRESKEKRNESNNNDLKQTLAPNNDSSLFHH